MNTKDYLHFYLGCEVKAERVTVILHGENLQNAINLEWKPILRPLSDMTADEFKEMLPIFSLDIFNAYNSYIEWKDKPKHVLILENRLQTNTLLFSDGILLLQKHFDLFGLIDAGLVIDKNT